MTKNDITDTTAIDKCVSFIDSNLEIDNEGR